MEVYTKQACHLSVKAVNSSHRQE